MCSTQKRMVDGLQSQSLGTSHYTGTGNLQQDHRHISVSVYNLTGGGQKLFWSTPIRVHGLFWFLTVFLIVGIRDHSKNRIRKQFSFQLVVLSSITTETHPITTKADGLILFTVIELEKSQQGCAFFIQGGGYSLYMSYGDVRTIWVSFLLPKNL